MSLLKLQRPLANLLSRQKTLTTTSASFIAQRTKKTFPPDFGKKRFNQTTFIKAASSSSSNGNGPDIPSNVSKVFKPVVVTPNATEENLGEELTGKKLSRQDLLHQLNLFQSDEKIRAQCKRHGLDDYLYKQAFTSFRKFCLQVKHLQPELYVLFSDLLEGGRHIHDILPFFLQHAR